MKKSDEHLKHHPPGRGFAILRLLLILFIISLVISGCISFLLPSSEDISLVGSNVALIRVEGPILLGGSRIYSHLRPHRKTYSILLQKQMQTKILKQLSLKSIHPAALLLHHRRSLTLSRNQTK